MKRITLRLPDELCEEIERLATEENRSLNAEIVQAIKHYTAMAHRRTKGDKIAKSMDAGDYVELSPAEILALGS